MRYLCLAGFVFLGGCVDRSPVGAPAPTVEIVPPSCIRPAPLVGRFDPRAPGYIVDLSNGVDVAVETARLGEKYGFTARWVYTAVLGGFSAELTPQAVAGLRCERTVQSISFDQQVSIDE